MQDIYEFTIRGTLAAVRRPASGKCAFLTVETTEIRRGKEFKTNHDVITFDPSIVGNLDKGDRVTVKGRLGRSQLKDTKRHADNGMMYDVWAPQLIATLVTPERQAATGDPAGSDNPDDADLF